MIAPNMNQPIRLSGLLSAAAPNKVFIAILLGILSGFAYALIIPLVLTSLGQSDLDHQIEHIHDTAGEGQGEHFHLFGLFDISSPKLALAFFLVCLFILICRTTSQSLIARIAIDTTVNLRKSMYQRISKLPVRDLERIGPSRMLTALNNDIDQIIQGAAFFPGLISSLATVIGLLGFLIYLDIHIFFFIIGVILFGAITYQIPVIFAQRFLTIARKCFDNIQEGIRGLIYGAKELKLNQQRQQDFLTEDLYAVEETFRVSRKRGLTLLIFGLTYGDLISFFTIGVVNIRSRRRRKAGTGFRRCWQAHRPRDCRYGECFVRRLPSADQSSKLSCGSIEGEDRG